MMCLTLQWVLGTRGYKSPENRSGGSAPLRYVEEKVTLRGELKIVQLIAGWKWNKSHFSFNFLCSQFKTSSYELRVTFVHIINLVTIRYSLTWPKSIYKREQSN